MATAGAEDDGERLVFHPLVRADDALSDSHRERGYVSLCGRVLRTEELPSSRCERTGLEEDECRDVVVYRLDCLRDAANTNAGWGVPGE